MKYDVEIYLFKYYYSLQKYQNDKINVESWKLGALWHSKQRCKKDHVKEAEWSQSLTLNCSQKMFGTILFQSYEMMMNSWKLDAPTGKGCRGRQLCGSFLKNWWGGEFWNPKSWQLCVMNYGKLFKYGNLPPVTRGAGAALKSCFSQRPLATA